MKRHSFDLRSYAPLIHFDTFVKLRCVGIRKCHIFYCAVWQILFWRNLCIRYTFDLHKYDDSEYRAQFKLLSVSLWTNVNILSLLFCKPLNPFTLQFNRMFSIPALHIVPLFPLCYIYPTPFYSLPVSAMKLWNSLPNETRNST